MKIRYKYIDKKTLYADNDLVKELKKMTYNYGTLRPALEDKDIKKVWVAFHRNRPIGWCGLSYEDTYRKTGNELGVYVKQRYRGRGIGRKLLYMGCKGLRKYSWYNRKGDGWVDQNSKPQIELNRKPKKVEEPKPVPTNYNYTSLNDYSYTYYY